MGDQHSPRKSHEDTGNAEEQENLEIDTFPEYPDLKNVIEKMKNGHHEHGGLDIHEKNSDRDQKGRASEAGDGGGASSSIRRYEENDAR